VLLESHKEKGKKLRFTVTRELVIHGPLSVPKNTWWWWCRGFPSTTTVERDSMARRRGAETASLANRSAQNGSLINQT